MSYDSLERSRFDSLPYELYWFSMGAQDWRFTTGDQPRIYLGNTYGTESATRTAVDQNNELKSGAITVTIPRTHPLAQQFVGFVPPAPVSLVIYRGHDGEGDSETVSNFTGRVASATLREHCELNCVPEQDVLKRSIPIQRYQSQCNWPLYGPGCGVDRAAYAVLGIVTGIVGDAISVSTAGTKPDQWFRAGWVEFGEYRRMIVSHVGNSLTLITPFQGLAVDDQVTMYAGCPLTADVCASKFSNLPRFSGFPRIPTQNPFDGGIE